MKYRITIALAFLSFGLFAQSRQEKELFTKFESVCNAYKKLPLQLTLSYGTKSNILKKDTAMTEGSFFIANNGAYIRFADVEQIINDSFALTVMGSIHQMVLSKNAINISDQFNKMMSAPVSNISVEKFFEMYSIKETTEDPQSNILIVESKKKISGTNIPAEEINIKYNGKTSDPEKVETVKRTLVKKLDDSDVPETVKTVVLPDKGNYVLREESATYLYKKIEHEQNGPLPVVLSDRIKKDEFNNYTPVKAYEGYELKFN